MQQPGQQPDINATIAAWADIVLKIWRDKIIQLKVYRTGELYKSLKHEIQRNSDGNIDKIDFVFLVYGVYVDAGVGRGSRGSRDWLDATEFDEWDRKTDRVRKQWLSRTFYGQIMRLREILAERYRADITYIVSSHMKGGDVLIT